MATAQRIHKGQVSGAMTKAWVAQGGLQVQFAIIGQVECQMLAATIAQGGVQGGGDALAGPAALARCQGSALLSELAPKLASLRCGHGLNRTERKGASRSAAAGLTLEPYGSRWRQQHCPQAFRSLGGHAHGQGNICPRVLRYRLRDMALWRTSQETLGVIITVVRGGDSLDRAVNS